MPARIFVVSKLRTLWMLLALMIFVFTATVFGQAYPAKPVRIVTAEPGGSSDLVARVTAQALTGSLGQPVIVDNRGGGVISGETVAKAPGDGYTLLVSGSNLWITPLLQKVPYDPIKAFAPISLATISPNVLIVHPSLPVKSAKELIALAKPNPGVLNYGALGPGGTSYLAAELFNYMSGIKIVCIQYKGVAQALNDLISGQVQVGFNGITGVMPHVKAGKLRALAVTSATPSALLPALPTIAASGVPGYEAVSTFAVFAPAATPASIVKRLNQDIVQALNSADVKSRLFNAGVEAVGSSPEQLDAAMKSEIARMGDVIKRAGIRVE